MNRIRVDRDHGNVAAVLDWRRNLYVIWVAELVGVVGFTSAMPFLPYYVQALGITAPGQVELWSGLLHSMHALAMAVMAPLWGTLADRVGHKLMVERAMFGGALLLGAMALVSNVQQLLLLRVMQGAVTGTVVASTALVAAGTPSDQRASALGSLQMGVYVGGSLGPTLGGVLADALGYRAPFLATGVLLAVSGVSVLLLVQEVAPASGSTATASIVNGMRVVLRSPGVVAALTVRLMVRSAFRLVGPILPLFIQMLSPSSERLSSLVGLVTGASMGAGAVGALAVGPIGKRVGLRGVLNVSVAMCAVSLLVEAAVADVWQLLLPRAVTGLAMGGIITAISATLANSAPQGCEGAVFGLESTVVSAANTIGPMLGAAVAAAWSLRMPSAVAGLGFALALFILILQARLAQPVPGFSS